MPIIRSSSAPRFALPGLQVTGLASPSRGARETCMWRLVLAPGTPGALHTVDREEVFVATAGRATVSLGGVEHELSAGDALVVPAGEPFALANPGTEAFEAVVALPVGGRAAMPQGDAFIPPWAA
ncbi:MAG TPA: cupin domain-containing protein [Kofleriaceae bacterium]|nr:cupin domain-containing protein [Kofleriaceae bacterium]